MASERLVASDGKEFERLFERSGVEAVKDLVVL